MTAPQVVIEVLDGALATSPANIDGISAKVGISSAGTANTLYTFVRPQDVITTLGYGPLPEAITHHLEEAGGPVLAMKINGSVAGSNSAVTQTGGGPVVTLTGVPLDAYQGKVEVRSGGAVGTSTFRFTLDGGDTWSEDIVTAATYLMPNSGVTLNFAAGTYVLGTTYEWTSTSGYFNTTDLNTTIDALLANPAEWGFAHVVGRGTTAADSAAMAAALQTKLEGAATAGTRYVRGMVEMADDSDANLIAAFASVTTPRVDWAASFGELVSSVSGRIYKRPIAWGAAARRSKVALKTRVGIATSAAYVGDGPLNGYTSIYRDERVTPGLDPARFTTATTIIGKSGFFLTRSRLGAALGSDYARWENGRVVDKACRLIRFVMTDYLNDSVRTNPNGTIAELEARKIEGRLRQVLNNELFKTENVSAEVSVQIDRALNVVSTSRIVVDVRLQPRGYLEDIRVTVGFAVPLSLAA